MIVTFDVLYLPFTVGHDPLFKRTVVDRVGVPRWVECERSYWELMDDPSGPPGSYMLALGAGLKARCEVDDPLHTAPGGFLGTAGRLLGYAPFDYPDKLHRRLRARLYRGYAEQALRALQTEAALRGVRGYWGYGGNPDPQRLEAIIDGMFAA